MKPFKIVCGVLLFELCFVPATLAQTGGAKNLIMCTCGCQAMDPTDCLRSKKAFCSCGKESGNPCEQKRSALQANLDSRASEIQSKFGGNFGISIENSFSVGKGDGLPERYRAVQKLKKDLEKVPCDQIAGWAKDHGMGEDDLKAQSGKEEYQALIDSGMTRLQAIQHMQQEVENGMIGVQDDKSKIQALQDAKAKFSAVDPASVAVYDQKISDLKDQTAFVNEMAQNDAKLAGLLKNGSKGGTGVQPSDGAVAGNWLDFGGVRPGPPVAQDATKGGKSVDSGTGSNGSSSQMTPAGNDANTLGSKNGVFNAVTASRYDLEYNVPSLEQPNDNGCWATAAAGALTAHEGQTVTPEEAAKRAGPYFSNKLGNDESLNSTEDEAKFFSAHGMKSEPAADYSVGTFWRMLNDYGPYVVQTYSWSEKTKDDQGIWNNNNYTHDRLVVGMYGDGTPDHTFLIMNSSGRRDVESFGAFMTKYDKVGQLQNEIDTTSAPRLQIVHFNSKRPEAK